MRRLTIIVSALAALAVTTTGTLRTVAADDPPPIAVELITPRSVFPDSVSATIKVKPDATDVLRMTDPSRVVTAKITVQPGAQFPWHTHPGPVIVNVAQGALTYVPAADCTHHAYVAGEAFIDPGRGFVHTAFNPGSVVTVVYATFFEAPAAGPLTITEGVVAPADCDVQVGQHAH